jgi:hypothetical protein
MNFELSQPPGIFCLSRREDRWEELLAKRPAQKSSFLWAMAKKEFVNLSSWREGEIQSVHRRSEFANIAMRPHQTLVRKLKSSQNWACQCPLLVYRLVYRAVEASECAFALARSEGIGTSRCHWDAPCP